MTDTPNKKLADVFLDHSLQVKKHDRLVIMTSDLAHEELIRECYAGGLRRGAHVYLDVLGMNFVIDRTSACDLVSTFYRHAQDHHLDQIPKIHGHVIEWGNKFLRLTSIEKPQHIAHVPAHRIQRKAKAYRRIFDKIINKDWVLTYLPNKGFARQAGLSLKKLEEFYYASALVDYKKMEKSLAGLARVINQGKTVRIIGYKTDLTLGIAGRTAHPCFGSKNIPDGEVFTGPEEDKTAGHIYYDFPGLYAGKIIKGIYLEFKKGKVVKFFSETNQQALRDILNTDAGARRFGELAIGANFGIKKFMYNTLFDEKIGGTIHTALGKSYEDKLGWGRNKSAIHWDIVKDTRKNGSEVWIDNKLVVKAGRQLI